MSVVAFPDPGAAGDPADEDATPADPFAVELALGADGAAAALNQAGRLVAADIHAARSLGAIAQVSDPEVLLAVALTVAGARGGHSFLALDQAAAELELGDGWLTRLSSVPRLIATEREQRAPLRLEGSRLYLDRYWREEHRLASALLHRNRMRTDLGDLAALGGEIRRLIAEREDADQRRALAVAMLRDLTVLAGGPGTGKTTTVAWIVELTLRLAREAGRPEPLIALCAPTGKAAARLQEVVGGAAGGSEPVAGGLSPVSASTIHRLLGWLPGGRFRHDARNRLPHDLVIVDETSMVPLSMMVRLAEAVRDDAQLVLVGDPDQLSAIEVGAVLRDIVGPAAAGPRFGQAMQVAIERVTGAAVGGVEEPRSFGDAVVVLRHGHRSVEAIGALAEAIRRGDGDAVVAALRAGSEADTAAAAAAAAAAADVASPEPVPQNDEPLTLFDLPPAPPPPDATAATAATAATPNHGSAAVVWLPAADGGLDALRAEAVGALAPMLQAARAGDAAGALSLLRGFRLLCAHRHGPYGMSHWGAVVEAWLRDAVPGFASAGERYPGLPLLVTRNDYELRLRNGDTGVVVSGPGGPDTSDPRGGAVAVFDTAAGPVELAPSRLADVEPLYAATVYRSQGSEFDVAALVLPEPDSPLLTRELLYTGITRARRRLFLIGSEESVRAAVARPAGRASGLEELLWTDGA